MKPSTLIDRVKPLLQDYPHLRDSDLKLVGNVWTQEVRDNNKSIHAMTAKGLIDMMIGGKITNSDTITRCRRKLQEENPNLRGNKYKDRQGHQPDVIEDLGDDKFYPNDGQVDMFQ